MNLAELYPLSPEIFLACMGMALLIWAAIGGPKAALVINMAVGASFAGAFAILFCAAGPEKALLGGHVAMDGIGTLIKIVLLPTALAITVMSHDFLKGPE